MKICFIGLGVMGARMVERFLDAGHEVLVFNRTPEKAEALVKIGALRANDIPSLAEQSDVICSCLSMPEDSIKVFLEGVIPHARDGTICLDFSTVGVDTSRIIYQKAREKGIDYLDAPVSGGPEGVENGNLTIMVGGKKEAYERVLPLLNSLGEKIEYLGGSGSGSIAKLINQYLVAVHSIAASEAMVAGVAFGLDSEQLYKLLKVSYGQSRMLERHMEQYVLDRQFEPGGAVKYVHKDVKLANQLFEQVGLTETLGKLAENSFAHAMGIGLSDLDMSAVIKPLEDKTGVVVKR
ncbi:NAD(P)-dependent oxidoreductase [Robertmurraya kyonggiensis]|uniref:NAD(P)-dependent oxidoreductase n=1 Tax=Robertmurraya kyonggiensis TaxID=1037680 RepID=A0A4U1D9S6_9BACI|nr:NAD(P)-dependent oxidoreductase [Robertmurraya kyonggiensis]TKC19315.1 NAD(P)-dependent oxidoreductase [Robertmurraya kyonggiensis]